MKKVITVMLCVVMAVAMVACAGNNPNNDKYVGEWYWVEDPDIQTLCFTEDCEFLIDGDSFGEFEANEDFVTVTEINSGEQWDAYWTEVDGYLCLDIKDELFVKGYDNAVSYYETYCYVDPSDIWAYDFSGEYYEEYGNDSLDGLSEYEKMVKVKTEGGYTVDQQHGGFTLKDNYSGYWYGASDIAVTVDIDRENYIMRLVTPSGYIQDEFEIKWCEETQEFYFVYDGYSYDEYWFRLDNVQ